ncbi:hypothetical protein ACMA5I_06600 [Paracoccaceae bacterium GXU_MW_L88]
MQKMMMVKCDNCGWEGCTAEMGADSREISTARGNDELWSNYICPKCKFWHDEPPDVDLKALTPDINDRASQPKAAGKCSICGSHVWSYPANKELIAQRPEGGDDDFWALCVNAECLNAYGEGYCMSMPDWVEQC